MHAGSLESMKEAKELFKAKPIAIFFMSALQTSQDLYLFKTLSDVHFFQKLKGPELTGHEG